MITATLDGILSVIDNHHIAGDKYFTLYERTEGDIKRYQDRIAQLAVLLKDVEDSRKQLVTNCLQRVGRLYENLTILSFVIVAPFYAPDVFDLICIVAVILFRH